MVRKVIGSFRIVMIAIVVILHSIAYAENLETLDHLMMHQRYEKAYVLAQKLAPTYEGNPRFDSLYATAALRNQHPEVAIFPLERLVIQKPHHQDTWLSLGIAYFELGDLAAAVSIFNKLMQQNLSYDNQSVVKYYLKKIQDKKDRARTKMFGLLALNIGYNTNINSLVNANAVSAPEVGILILGPFQKGMASFYNAESLYTGIIHRISEGSTTTVSGIAGFYGRQNDKTYRYNYDIFDGTLGVSGIAGQYRLKFPIRFRQYNFSIFPQRNIFDISAQTERYMTRTQLLGLALTGEHITVKNRMGQPNPSGNLLIVDGMWTYRPSGMPLDCLMMLSAATGNAQDINSAFLFRNYNRAWLNLEWKGILKQKPYITLEYLQAYYRRANPTFLVKRLDNNYSVLFGWRFEIGRNWAIQPSYSYLYSQSNVPLFTFHRNIIQLALELKLEN